MHGAGTSPMDMSAEPTPHSGLQRLWQAYRLRWKRRYFLVRAFRKRRQLRCLQDRTKAIQAGDILGFSTMRNEMLRLPGYLDHYRQLGVRHFLIVDNDSDDGTTDYLLRQPDVSLWHSADSYKASRFGVDWLTWLQFRYGHGHWCMTADADELFCFPHDDKLGLLGLTNWLDRSGLETISTIMIELYPKGPISETPATEGSILKHLRWFDADNFWATPRADGLGQVVRGGVRARHFFQDEPARAPTMNKLPLVKWSWRYAYVSSTHVALPKSLNALHWARDTAPTGALLHTKFFHDAPARAVMEKARGEHFGDGMLYADYYGGVAADPDFWSETSSEFTGWQALEVLGLIQAGALADAAETGSEPPN